jgi:fluoride exporter
MAYLWIAIGSALGGMARYWCTDVSGRLLGATFPWGTLFINVLGSFVIGLFFALTGTGGRFDVSNDLKLFVMVGICGGYTTFSAFSLQTLALFQEHQWARGSSYIAASVVLCLIAVWAGYALATVFNAAK